MKKVNVLLVNFDLENNMQPWVDSGMLYTIYIGKKIEDVKKFYKKYKFDLVFFKISKNSTGKFHEIEYLKDIFSYSKIIAVSETPTFQDAFRYTKYGAYDFRKIFRNFAEFMGSLRYYSQRSIFRNLLDSMKTQLTDLFRKDALLSPSRTITNTALACLLKSKGEHETMEHLSAVGQYARLICEKLRMTKRWDKILTQKYAEYIYFGCMLHDIGKINIPQDIIMKPCYLTEQEFEVVKTHTHYGYEILLAVEKSMGGSLRDFFDVVKGSVFYHHENYNGTGYPYGLKDKDIPLHAKICALADSYAALSSDRPYRTALPHEQICNIILYKQKYKYDPELLEIFGQYNEEFEEISCIFRKNGEIYGNKRMKKQCAWCKSLFLFNKWLPYSEFVHATHGFCPTCSKKIQEDVGMLSVQE